jgi:general secretion pathway protein D
LLTRLMPEAAAQQNIPGATPKMVVTVDPRSNTLFVRSDNPSNVNRVRSLVTGLDTPTAATGNIHVVYLRNAEATKVAETLRGLLSGQSQNAPTSLGASPSLAPTSTATGAAPTAPGTFATSTAGGGASQPTSSTIQAYPATNSLVIIAPDNLYNQLRSVIDKLDARRAQVFIEALLVEVNATLGAEFGIQWQNLEGLNKDGTNVIGGTNFTSPATSANIIGVSQNLTTIGSGFNIGVVRGQVNIPGIGNVINLGVLAKALESHGKTNILSTPNILTLDNEEAKIVVGQNVPFVTGSYAQTTTGTAGSTVSPFQTVERKDVGLTLKVKPTVAEGGSIKMQLYQEASSIDTTINTNGAGLVTNKRSIESTVLVDDGQIIVLGGLIQDQTQDNNSQVPVLGSIPIFGNLFKSQTRNRTKSNLMVFLRPFVLRDDQLSSKLTGDRYDYIRNEQIKSTPEWHLMLPDIDGPILPENTIENKSNPDYTPPQQPTQK